MSAETLVYPDSSAIVRPVVREPETASLRRHLRRRTTLASSALARTEVLRAVMAHGEPATKLARVVLGRLELLRINDRVPRTASALTLGSDLKRVLCYDARLTEAFEDRGLKVVAPA